MDYNILIHDLADKQKKVYNHYGEFTQYNKLLEESEEFKEALEEECSIKILEEGADLMNMTLQHIYAEGYTFDDIITQLFFKTDRELGRIKNES